MRSGVDTAGASAPPSDSSPAAARADTGHACAVCKVASGHKGDFATVQCGRWHDGARWRDARTVLVCTRCLVGDLPPAGIPRVIAAGLAALFGGAS